MANWIIEQLVDLSRGAPTPRVWPDSLMLCGDNLAHEWRVTLVSQGAPADLSGYSAAGYFRRVDGNTVRVNGTITGNQAKVIFPDTCYAYAGELDGVLQISTGAKRITISALVFQVRKTISDAIIDPGSAIPNLEQLLNLIASIESAETTRQGQEAARQTAEATRAAFYTGFSAQLADIMNGTALANGAISPAKLATLEKAGILSGVLEIDYYNRKIIAYAGCQCVYEGSNGVPYAAHLTDSPYTANKEYTIDSGINLNYPLAILLSKSGFTILSLYYGDLTANVATYRTNYRLLGILYAGILFDGMPGGSGRVRYRTTANILCNETILAASSITTEKITAGAVETTRLADGAVTTAKLANLAVTKEKLAASAVTNDKLLKNSIASAKHALHSFARNYPLATNANGYRSSTGSTSDLPFGDMIHQLFFYGTHDRYYISSFWSNHATAHTRCIGIKSSDNTDVISFTGQPTYDASSNLIYPTMEYCELTDSSGNSRGFAIISWTTSDQIPDYALSDTEIHASCFINVDRLADNLPADYDVAFHVDDTYHMAARGEMNFYFDAIVELKRPMDVYYRVTCATLSYAYINQLQECIRITPDSSCVGTHTISVSVYKASTREVITTQSFSVVIHADAELSGTDAIKAIHIGDSLTAAGTIQNTVKDLFGDNYTLYGTLGTAPYNHEGRSSWSTADYFAASKNGVTNPFYNPTAETFDFAYYMTNNPTFADVDLVKIFLGRNDGFTSAALITNLEAMIASIHAYNANIVVTLYSAYHTGATNDGTGLYMQNTWLFRQDTFDGNDALAEQFAGRESEKVFLIPEHINLDTLYDYPHSSVAVSNRNPETVSRINNNVHPNSYGYMKFADVEYGYDQYIRSLGYLD